MPTFRVALRTTAVGFLDVEADDEVLEVCHAQGRMATLCGVQMMLLPMNFAPPKFFGVGPTATRGRPWCPDCLAAKARGGA